MFSFIKKMNFLSDDKGAAAVEFALLAPILGILLIGTIDTGIYIQERMKIQNTAYAAADFVAQTADDQGVTQIARDSYNGDFNDINLTTSFVCQCSDGVELECPVTCAGSDYSRRYVRVTVDGNFDPMFNYGEYIPGAALSSTVKMRVD